MLKDKCGLSERYATVEDVKEHAGTLPSPLSTGEYRRIHVWGPVLKHAAERVGAITAAASVCLNVMSLLPVDLVERVKAVVPDAVKPMPDDTPDSLMQRIRDSGFFEPAKVFKSGSGPQRVQLLGTTYPQPRRKSWSVVGSHGGICDAYWDEETEAYVYDAFNYTAAKRLAEDWKAYPMPLAVFELGVALWRIALPFLHGPSTKEPPNGCQLCAYYSLFGGAMVRHRDNFTTEQMLEHGLSSERHTFDEWMRVLPGSHHGGDANSQVLGSFVLVWTDGDAPMDFKLSFPPPDARDTHRGNYLIHPLFTVSLSRGTLYIFPPLDDIFFCHEAVFPAGAHGYRHAFVFRWLSSARQFYLDNHAMKLHARLQEQKEAREAAAREKKKRERTALFTGPFGV